MTATVDPTPHAPGRVTRALSCRNSLRRTWRDLQAIRREVAGWVGGDGGYVDSDVLPALIAAQELVQSAGDALNREAARCGAALGEVVRDG